MPGLVEEDLSMTDLIDKWSKFSSIKKDKENNICLDLEVKSQGEEKYWNILSELNNSNENFNKYLIEKFEVKSKNKEEEDKEIVSKEEDKNKTLYNSKDFEKLENLKIKLHSILDKLNANIVDPKKISSISSKVNKISSNIEAASEEINDKCIK